MPDDKEKKTRKRKPARFVIQEGYEAEIDGELMTVMVDKVFLDGNPPPPSTADCLAIIRANEWIGRLNIIQIKLSIESDVKQIQTMTITEIE